jgi:hypothetical protein
MKACKRIEIVLDQTLAPKLEQMLKNLGIDGYTRISDAGGLGDRGYRRADEVTGASSNCIFILALEDNDQVSEVVSAIKPFLKSSGGICLVSDALSVIH